MRILLLLRRRELVVLTEVGFFASVVSRAFGGRRLLLACQIGGAHTLALFSFSLRRRIVT